MQYHTIAQIRNLSEKTKVNYSLKNILKYTQSDLGKKYKNEKEEITEDNKNNDKKVGMNLREKENKNRKEKKRNMQIKESNTKTDSKEKTNNSLLNISKENNTKRSNISKNSKIKTQLKINNEGEIHPF